MRAAVAAAMLAFAAGCAAPRLRSDAPPVRFEHRASRPLGAADAGPTIRLGYGTDAAAGSPIADFTYFVPLIAPEPVACAASPGNSQRVRVRAIRSRWDEGAFETLCDFEIVGKGSQRYTFDHTPQLERHARKLSQGEALTRLLHVIQFEGGGCGRVEVRGAIVGSVAAVTEVSLRFGQRDRSPVTVLLHDVAREEGRVVERNPIAARVDALTFRREDGPPRMAVSLASVKSPDAGSGWWADAKGALAARFANLVVKPLPIEPAGLEAMLDFGRALTRRDPAFTFPKARNLRTGSR